MGLISWMGTLEAIWVVVETMPLSLTQGTVFFGTCLFAFLGKSETEITFVVSLLMMLATPNPEQSLRCLPQ